MMLSRYALVLLAAFALSACQKDAPAPVASEAATSASSQTTSEEDPQRIAAAEAAIKAAEDAAASSPPPVEGTDYVLTPNGLPFDTPADKVEIVEFFGYVCPFCAAVQPTAAAMKAKLPPDVNFIYVPAPFGSMWDNYAKAYYAAEAMGIADKSHDAMYRAIHIDKTLKGELGMDKPEEIAAFYSQYGVDAGLFLSTMQSFAIDSKVNRARQYMTESFNGEQMGTPSFLVAGKYLVKGKSIDDMFRIINQLVVAERKKLASRAPATTEAPAQEASEAAPATP